MLGKFLKSRRVAVVPDDEVPPGQRVYAIGDIHGRLDLLDRLLDQIEADDARRGSAESVLVFLGDLVDRGPQSAQVVDRLMALAERRPTSRFLLGNHEEMFLLTLAGDPKALRAFCRVGGRETAISYGIPADTYERLSYEELLDELVARVPAAHVAFLSAFEDMVTIGDYAFVHAGVRPGLALADQRGEELRWLREPFLRHRGGWRRWSSTVTPSLIRSSSCRTGSASTPVPMRPNGSPRSDFRRPTAGCCRRDLLHVFGAVGSTPGHYNSVTFIGI